MPKVGDKEFSYDAEGLAQAEAVAEQTGEPIIRTDSANELPTYDAGGRVQNIQGYGEGGKVEKAEHPFTKRYRESKEKDIKRAAKGIVSGKYKNMDITNIVRDVASKKESTKRMDKAAKEADKRYKKKNK